MATILDLGTTRLGTQRMALPLRGQFTPRFIQPSELSQFGLPDQSTQSNILSLVDGASSLIDQYCGRTDGSGQGSLVYSTYSERILMQSASRNRVRVSFKPLVAIDVTTVNNLQASANAPLTSPTGDPLLNTNWYWTGCLPSTIVAPSVGLSPILGCSGRYGYARRNAAQVYPDLSYGLNPLMVAAFFGGPPNWTPIDVTMIDVDMQTQSGEVWVPAGLYMSQYTEIIAIYNSGWNPLAMPPAIKQACAALVRNYLSRAGGVTGLRSMTAAGTVNVGFSEELIDPTIMRMLQPFCNVIAY